MNYSKAGIELRSKINLQSLEDAQARNTLKNTVWNNTVWKNHEILRFWSYISREKLLKFNLINQVIQKNEINKTDCDLVFLESDFRSETFQIFCRKFLIEMDLLSAKTCFEQCDITNLKVRQNKFEVDLNKPLTHYPIIALLRGSHGLSAQRA